MTVRVGPAGPPVRGYTMEPEVLRQNVAALVGQPGVVGAGDLAVTQSGSPGMSVVVAGGVAIILGTDVPVIQGNYNFTNDGPETVVIAASDPSLDRIDAVIAQIQDVFYGGPSNDPQLVAITGTPAGSPVVPALPASSMLLATVSVVHGSTSVLNANITDARQSTTAGVAAPYVRNTAPGAPAGAGTSQELADDDQGNLYEYISGAWHTVANATIFGTGGAIAGSPPSAAAGRFLVQTGTNVQAIGSGGFVFTFPTAFPNGLLTFLAFNGDDGGSPAHLAMSTFLPATTRGQVNVTCRDSTNGNLIAGTPNVRFNWIAIGW